MQIKHNCSVRKTPVKYIVIHDTGNMKKGADAMAHFNFFNSADRGSSADVFIDDKICLKVNDYNKYYTWHCGDGNGKNGISNSNSVGVEICINVDGNFSLALSNAAVFVKKLMKELNIPLKNVVRHYDASGKNCPQSMNKDNWALWRKFKDMISESEEITMTQYEELKKEIDTLKAHAGKVYHYGSELPDWAVPTIQKLLDKGIYKGESEGDLNLPESVMRVLVINDRAGLYD